MRSFVLASLLLAAAGCQPPLPERPGQADALAQIWKAYGADVAPPLVEWRQDVCPSKPDGPTAVVEDGLCYAGLYLRDDRALVAWRGSFSSSAFSHELMHALQWAHGIDDPNHLRTPDWTLSADTDRALREQGY